MSRIYTSTICGMFSIGALAYGAPASVCCTDMSVPEDGGGSMTHSDGTGASTPTGAKLFTMIAEDDPSQQWAPFPDHQGLQPSLSPHGPMSKVEGRKSKIESRRSGGG